MRFDPHPPARDLRRSLVALMAVGLGAISDGALAREKPRPAPVAPVVAAAPTPAPTPAPEAPEATAALTVKYVRDSAEYAALTRMVYGFASQAVVSAADAARQAGETGTLAVVLDIDETALDNSVYQLECEAYHVPFSPASWNAWVRRQAAGVVPGVAEFLRDVRARGVRVAWISNRDHDLAEATRANLDAWRLWEAGDRLCLRLAPGGSKRTRRDQVRGGEGACGFGAPARVLAYVGDQMADFPDDGEEAAPRSSALGLRDFILPDPLYGAWTRAVTRPLP